MIKNRISVIIPVYNGQNFLSRCLDSVVTQNYRNIEIIIIDDGSTDDSGKIIDRYCTKDNRVKAIHQKQSGAAAARNIGIKKSTGEYIFLIDADDYLIKKKALSLLIENSKKFKTDLTVGDFITQNHLRYSPAERYLLSTNKLLNKQDIVVYVNNYLKKPVSYSMFIFIWGKLFKSSIIKKNRIFFNKNLPVYEDILFNFDYLQFVSSVYYVRQHLSVYNIFHSVKSAGGNIYDNPVGFKPAIKNIGRFLNARGVKKEQIKKNLGHAYIYFAIRTLVLFFTYNTANLRQLYRLIYIIINDPDIRNNLPYYSPSKDDSKIIPVLLKLKLVWPIIFICKYKAYKNANKRSEKE